MISDILWGILRYGGCVALGIVIGNMFTAGRFKWRNRSYVVPYIPKSGKNITIVAFVLVILSVFAVVNTSVSNARQTNCNSEFRRVIAERAQITAEDSKLASKADMLTITENDARVEYLQGVVNSGVDGNSSTQARIDAAKKYLQVSLEVAVERKSLNDQKQKLIAQRTANPIPEPKCNN